MTNPLTALASLGRRALAAVGLMRQAPALPGGQRAQDATFARATVKGARGSAGTVEQGDVSTYRRWTPDLIELAELTADRGDLTLAAELCDALIADPLVGEKLGERVRSLVGAPIAWESGRGRRKGMAVKAIEGQEDFWELLPDAEYAQLVSWGVMLGVGVGQFREWAPRKDHGGRLLPKELAVWHMRDVKFNWQTRMWEVRSGDGQNVEVRSGDGQWFFYTPFGKFRPWIWGKWRAIARLWLLRMIAIEEWRIANQTNGAKVISAPLPHVNQDDLYLEDYTPEYRSKLVRDLRGMGRRGVIALQPGLKLELLEVGAESWESFLKQIEICDALITTCLVGSTLATSGDKASYASAQTGYQVAEDIRSADANVECTMVHDDVLVPWAVYNFGDESAAPWPMRQVKPKPTLGELGEAFEKYGNGLAALREKGGMPIDAEAMSEGVPEIKLLPPEKRPKQAAPIYQYMLENPIFTVGEARKQYGLEPFGDERDDMFPAELLAKITAAAAPPKLLPPKGGTGGAGGDGGGFPPAKADAGGKAGFALARHRRGRGFVDMAVEGQLYADRVVREAMPLAAPSVEEILLATIAAVQGAETFDEVRARLIAVAGDDAIGEPLRDVLERTAAMAWAAGAFSASEELEGDGGGAP